MSETRLLQTANEALLEEQPEDDGAGKSGVLGLDVSAAGKRTVPFRLLGNPLWGPAIAAVAALCAAWLVFPPVSRFVVIDEWAYAKSALALAEEGIFRPHPTAVAPDLVPVALAALLSKIGGDVIFWLRITSGLSLIFVAVLSAGVARELGARNAVAFAVGLLSALNPIALALAVTGMSDLPGLALLLLGCYCGIRYLKTLKTSWLAGCALASLLGASTRPPAGLPIAVVTLLGTIATLRNRRLVVSIPTGFLCGVLLALGWWIYTRQSISAEYYVEAAEGVIGRSWLKMVAVYPVQALLYLALIALPLAAGSLLANLMSRPKIRAIQLSASGLLGAALALVSAPGRFRFPYMAWGSVVAPNGIGGGDRPQLPSALLIGVSAVAAMAACVLVTELARSASARCQTRETASRQDVPASDLPDDSYRGRRLGRVGGVLTWIWRHRSEAFVVVLALSAAAIVGTMGLAFRDDRTGYDRYLLPALVPAACLLGARLYPGRFSWRAAGVAAAVVVTVTIVGLQDWRSHRQAAWSALEQLQASGVPVLQIDGGFEWDAYHHPSEYTPRFEARGSGDAPWYIREFAPLVDRRYVLDSRQLDGYEVVEVVEWRSWMRHGTLYLQRRRG
jgi:hypothetical protein